MVSLCGSLHLNVFTKRVLNEFVDDNLMKGVGSAITSLAVHSLLQKIGFRIKTNATRESWVERRKIFGAERCAFKDERPSGVGLIFNFSPDNRPDVLMVHFQKPVNRL